MARKADAEPEAGSEPGQEARADAVAAAQQGPEAEGELSGETAASAAGDGSRRRGGRRFKRGSVLIVLGIVLIAAAAGLFAYNEWDSSRAGEEASSALSQLDANIGAQKDATAAEEAMWDKNASMPTKYINGYNYLGKISVPSLNLELPVMARWNYDRLRIAPCRYSGSYWADDLVICGHNYASHFSPLRWVDIGADVYFTNVKGLRIHYVVSNLETVQPTAIEDMIDNDKNSEVSADWDLTLFTCNLGGQTRHAVRCIRK